MNTTPGPLGPIFARVGGPPATSGERSDKKNFAERLSRELALLFATALRRRFPEARITPLPDGSQQEFRIGGALDAKKTDVAVWDDRAGLVLGISIKTITAKDASTQRYTKNMVRNDMELRDEADKLHRRQPWAVLAAIIFLPEESAWDGRDAGSNSSFAHGVFTFRKRSGRDHAHAVRFDLFEHVYVGLFDSAGNVGFFDVMEAPPRNQMPLTLLTFDELISNLEGSVATRHAHGGLETYAEDDLEWSPPPSGAESALTRLLWNRQDYGENT